MSFSFGVKKKIKKAAKKKAAAKKWINPELTEDDVREDNPELTEFLKPKEIDPEKQRFNRENELAKKKQNDQNDAHFYVCVVFQSWDQKVEFLDQIPEVLAVDDIFIDGETFAKAVGKPVTHNQLPPFDTRVSGKLSERAKIPKE